MQNDGQRNNATAHHRKNSAMTNKKRSKIIEASS
jgi:hypothetical protein